MFRFSVTVHFDLRRIPTYLKRYSEESNYDIRQRQVGDEAVGNVLHASASGHNPHNQGIPNDSHDRNGAVEK
jgi:hypothetical protein